jgi:hypothetical protein
MSGRSIYLSRLALPISWEALDGAPSTEDCGKATWANAGVFSLLLHAIDVDAAQRPSDERLAEALAPLRIKLDIVIEMLGRLAYRDVEPPPVCNIEFATDRIGWESPRPLRVGDWLRIKLYFDPNFLEPIVLYGCVASAIPEDATGTCGVQAELVETSLETEEAVARLAFLAQRRQLAQRQPPSTARTTR